MSADVDDCELIKSYNQFAIRLTRPILSIWAGRILGCLGVIDSACG